MCETQDVYAAYCQTAIRVAQLIREDPDGAVLDRAEERFAAAESRWLELWDGTDVHAG